MPCTHADRTQAHVERRPPRALCAVCFGFVRAVSIARTSTSRIPTGTAVTKGVFLGFSAQPSYTVLCAQLRVQPRLQTRDELTAQHTCVKKAV